MAKSRQDGPQKSKKAAKSRYHCAVPPVAERVFDAKVTRNRARLIRSTDAKWANGTVLHYHFLQKPKKLRGRETEEEVVRKAFGIWKDVGIGLEFAEVETAAEAEIKIAFLRGDGAWSYYKNDILECGPTEQTMNFGWNVSNEIDTPIHEIGHTIGFPHEHQNPNAGIEWNEEKVYAFFKENDDWNREETHDNVIKKLDPDDVRGSKWDPKSIMHYDFSAELIDEPSPYNTKGVDRPVELSTLDKKWVKKFYPPLGPSDYKPLQPFKSVPLKLAPAEQANFLVRPEETRTFQFQTFGPCDGVLVLFEEVDGVLRYLKAHDNSGTDDDARVEVRLFAGRSYVARLRVYHTSTDDFSLMMW